MARGDVVSGIGSIAAGASLVFQPAVGIEAMITEVGSNRWAGGINSETPHIAVRLTTGVLVSMVRHSESTIHWNGKVLKLFITNSLYLSLHNASATTAYIAYSGIQTK